MPSDSRRWAPNSQSLPISWAHRPRPLPLNPKQHPGLLPPTECLVPHALRWPVLPCPCGLPSEPFHTGPSPALPTPPQSTHCHFVWEIHGLRRSFAPRRERFAGRGQPPVCPAPLSLAVACRLATKTVGGGMSFSANDPPPHRRVTPLFWLHKQRHIDIAEGAAGGVNWRAKG